jgi:hypothetical protein
MIHNSQDSGGGGGGGASGTGGPLSTLARAILSQPTRWSLQVTGAAIALTELTTAPILACVDIVNLQRLIAMSQAKGPGLRRGGISVYICQCHDCFRCSMSSQSNHIHSHHGFSKVYAQVGSPAETVGMSSR